MSNKEKVFILDQTNHRKDFLFSVIIPVYNCDQYLSDAIDSIISQTIGFDKIQIILINDGSTDRSEDICLQYQSHYPANIIYLRQENSGVSTARNLGMQYMEGKYVSFLDSDDKWQNNVFAKANAMFEKNSKVDVIGVRVHFFEGSNAYHPLDYKFKSKRDRVVDIFNSYDHVQLAVTSALFRVDQIRDLSFDAKLKYGEDAKFIYQVITKNEKLGLITSSEQFYRKRLAGNSAIQSKSRDGDWYTTVLDRYHDWMINESVKQYGYVIPYVQYAIMYELQWRAKETIDASMPEDTIASYVDRIKRTLAHIDDRIILEQRNLSGEYKLEFLKLKYGEQVYDRITYSRHSIYYNNLYLLKLTGYNILRINTFNIDDRRITISGTINCCLLRKSFNAYVSVNGNDIPIKLIKTDINTRRFFGKPFISNYGFLVQVKQESTLRILFKIVYKDHFATNLVFSTGSQAKIGMNCRRFIVHDDGIYNCRKRKIIKVQKTPRALLRRHLSYILWLARRKRYDMIALRIYCIALRQLLKVINKQIWLISDRPDAANDNGAVLFEYLSANKPRNVIPYFTVSKNANEYHQLKRYGKVINFGSFRYKVISLISSENISSQADDIVVNPLGKDSMYMKDMYCNQFIFLQHGVIKDDLSSWLNIFTKDIKGFVCTTKPERDSLMSGNYHYSNQAIWMTGLPRYDKLSSRPQGKILIMPTWRKDLSLPIDPSTGTRPYNSKFKNSKFFEFYNRLVNDQRIIDKARRHGYTVELVLHQTLASNKTDFQPHNDIVDIQTDANYNHLFCSGNLLVTDYSSVAFDFAYLKKPIIYTQFDKDEFFNTHTYKPGYYSYEKDGFGPVCYDYESTVKAICNAIDGGCRMPEQYRRRVDRTFIYHDKNNCQRVVNKILELDASQEKQRKEKHRYEANGKLNKQVGGRKGK